MKNEEVTIIIAEDDDGHARLIEDHLRSAGVNNTIVRLRDGRETLGYLRGSAGAGDSPRLLLLDISMPVIDGIEVLKSIKSDEQMKAIPVIMLTSTDDPRDVETCYKAGCNNYLTKPVAFLDFSEVVRRLGLFISIVKVPKV